MARAAQLRRSFLALSLLALLPNGLCQTLGRVDQMQREMEGALKQEQHSNITITLSHSNSSSSSSEAGQAKTGDESSEQPRMERAAGGTEAATAAATAAAAAAAAASAAATTEPVAKAERADRRAGGAAGRPKAEAVEAAASAPGAQKHTEEAAAEAEPRGRGAETWAGAEEGEGSKGAQGGEGPREQRQGEDGEGQKKEARGEAERPSKKEDGGEELPPWLSTLQQSPHWSVTPSYRGVPGATAVADRLSWACMLVLQDVCHFALPAHHFSGFWYSLRGSNLSAVVSDHDVCGHAGRTPPSTFDNSMFHNLGDFFWIEEKFGLFLSEEKRAELMGGRRVRDVDSGSVKEEMRMAAGEEGVPRRRNRAVAVVSPHDAVVGHFVEKVGVLAEISVALASSLPSPPSPPSPASSPHPASASASASASSRLGSVLLDLAFSLGYPSSEAVMLFARDGSTSDTAFSGNVSQLLFGERMRVMRGRERPFLAHECFHTVLLPVNNFYSSQSAMSFGRRVRQWAKAQSVHSVCRNKTDPEEGTGAGSEWNTPSQVTWLWRGERRRIGNPGDVLSALTDVIQMPVQAVSFNRHTPFLQMVLTMQRSAIMLGMHGGAFGNEIFMQAGTAVLEILPYKCDYLPYFNIATQFGMRAYQWKDPKADPKAYDRDCLTERFIRMSPEECWTVLECMQCVRDAPVTRVDVDSFRALLGQINNDLLDTPKH